MYFYNVENWYIKLTYLFYKLIVVLRSGTFVAF